MKLYIKNMVCDRCKRAVRDIVEDIGLEPIQVELGEIDIKDKDISPVRELLINKLETEGFSLLNDKKAQIIEKIKSTIIELIHYKENNLDMNLSEYLSKQMYKEYSYLSNVFSEVEGVTIEKFYILQKIEKVKELLVYGDLTLSEIAYLLNYSSTAHLSNQFKSVTGTTPTKFKKLRKMHRHSIDKL